MTTGSDDKQLVNTLVTVVNTLSIPLLQRDRTLPVTSDEKKRVFFLGDYKCKIGIGKHRLTTFAKHYSSKTHFFITEYDRNQENRDCRTRHPYGAL